MPMMPFIGVRISWLMLARNSLFARLPSSARSLAVDKLGVDRHELRRSRVDLLLQVRLMVLQLCVALVNLSEHLVETVDQRADLVLAVPFDPDGVRLFVRDRSRRRGEPQDRARNESLQHPRDGETR